VRCVDVHASRPTRSCSMLRHHVVWLFFKAVLWSPSWFSSRRLALLAGGDAAALLLFAAVGRGSHAELDGIAGVLDTAWPFLLGASICMAAGSCVWEELLRLVLSYRLQREQRAHTGYTGWRVAAECV